MRKGLPFSALSALQRAEALLDAASFTRFPDTDSTMVLVFGEGSIAGVPVLVALLDGHVQGGTVGTHEASILAQLEHRAADGRRRPLILGFDTGGVRVEEGPRALAAASAVGVALARLTLLGVPVAGIISGPRGCFGALAVMAALPDCVLMTENAHWGLTGPKLLGDIHGATDEAVYAATSAARRLANGDAHQVIADDPQALRSALIAFVREPQTIESPQERLLRSARTTQILREGFRTKNPELAHPSVRTSARRRDLLRYSFRGQWHPGDTVQRAGLVHAALGTLSTHPALGLVVGPEESIDNGVGIDEAAVITDMLCRLAQQADQPAFVLTFLFCQGHAVDYRQEEFGLHRALAECLRSMVATRILGHGIVSILGGGTYGAAYLSLAAPSHRILAMRGTSVAPMSPQVLRAFQSLRGHKSGHEEEAQLAELIPHIRMVDSVIRLPRVLRDEIEQLLVEARPEVDAA